MKERINIKKLLAPSDSVSIVVILVGLLIAIALPEIAIRLIGVSVAILGSVALFLQISSRMKDFVGSKYKPSTPPPSFKITDFKDKSARRQVIEDFNSTFGPEEISSKEKVPEPIKELTESPLDNNDELEFKIVGKTGLNDDFGATDITAPTKPEQPDYVAPKAVTEKQILNLPVDEDSGMRIVGTMKTDSEIQSKKSRDEENKSQPAIEESQKFVRPNLEVHDDDSEFTVLIPDKKASSVDFHQIQDEIEKDIQFDLKNQTEQQPRQVAETKFQETQPPVNLKGVIPQSKISKDFKEKQLEIPLNTLMDDIQLTGQEPKKEFEYFLKRVLILIRSVTSTKTAAFFLVNMEKRELILESFDSDVPDAITTKTKLPLRNDVVSQIVMNVKPEILSEINPSAETDLIPYYSKPVGVSSFIGVPVFYNNSVIGIIVADSSIVDAYDSVTVGFLGHFTKLLGGLVQSYTEKYELMQASRTLNAISSFRQMLKSGNMNLQGISDSIVEAASKIFDFTMLGLICFDDSMNAWKIYSLKAKTKDPATNLRNFKIDLQTTLVGKAIVTGKTIFVSPVKESSIRVHTREQKLKNGYFAAVPLKSLNNTYGAIFVEGRSAAGITSTDMTILETLAENAGTTIEHLLFVDMFQNAAMIDSETGMLNPPAFFGRLEEEMIKFNEFKNDLSLCLFQIDNYAALDPVQFRDRTEKVYYHVINIIRGRLKPYHILGRVDDNVFGIILIGMNLVDAHRNIERIRQEIVRSFLEINKKRYNVTASFGLAQALKSDNLESLIANSQRVLEISVQKTNTLTVFE